uniref:Uncharacterized protein n=1 Tax=Sphaerodactylus townsendi TaxID=933632 RepID=A0ACB8FLX7_9SAUR
MPYLEECSFILRFRTGSLSPGDRKPQVPLQVREVSATAPSAETAFINLTLKAMGCLAFFSDRQGAVLYPHGKRGLLCLGHSPADSGECYLAQRECKNVVANGYCGEPETNFHVLWHCGKICLRASNGCYLGSLPVGLVAARALHPGPNEEFSLRLANRSFVLLRGPYGYVGCAPGHSVLQCNFLEPDCIELLPCKHGVYHLQTRGKSFWSLTSEKTFETGGKSALNFCLEIRGNNLLAILAPNGYYLRGDREGTLKADGEEVTSETLWEF